MKRTTTVFSMIVMILFTIQAQGQNTITFKFSPHGSDSCIVSFVDTVKNEVLRSFSIVEYSPYWNLPFEDTGDTILKQSKTFDLRGGISKSEIFQDFINYSKQPSYPSYCGREPLAASTYSTIIISDNKQFAIIPHYLRIYSDYCLYGYKAVLHIYNSKGELYRTIKTSDIDITSVAITDDGKYLAHTYGVHLDDEGLDWTNTGYRILDIENNTIVYNQLIEFINSYYDISIASYGNIISVFYTDQSNLRKYLTHTYCFDENSKYVSAFDKSLINRFHFISDSGFVFGVNNRFDKNKEIIRFNEGFNIEKIK
jgi:hypothetical protein